MAATPPPRNERADAPKAPVRQCVSCRERETRGDLVRLVVGPDGQIAVDARARIGGRGAWVHATRGCLSAAEKKHLAERSLKVPVSRGSGGDLVANVRDALARKAASLVGVAKRKSELAVGAAGVAETLERRRVWLLVVANDSLESDVVVKTTRDHGAVPVAVMGRRSELGALLGRDEVAIAAITDRSIAEELKRTLDRMSGLEGR